MKASESKHIYNDHTLLLLLYYALLTSMSFIILHTEKPLCCEGTAVATAAPSKRC